MSNKVDKLFKEKLEGHSLQPSAQAWEKVEAHLGKKNKMALWLRVAAAVAMLGLLLFAALNWERDYKEPAKQLVKEETKQGAGNRKQEVEKPVVNQKPKTQPKTQPKAQQKIVAPEVVDTPVERQIALEVTTNNQQPITNNQQPITNNQQPITNNQQKGITLTYSLPAIKKSEPVTETAVADTKKTGMQRVLEIAKDVKNGDNTLGELREAKNDILALEFRKDKDKKKQ